MTRTFTKSKLYAALAAMALSGAVAAAGTADPAAGTAEPQVQPDPQAVERDPGLAPDVRPTGPVIGDVPAAPPGIDPVGLTEEEHELFTAMDRTGDGLVTRDDLIGYFEEHAEDDRLTVEQFAAFMKTEEVAEVDELPERKQALFGAMDRDDDGEITREELLSWFDEHAEDERLTPAEFAAFVKSEAEHD